MDRTSLETLIKTSALLAPEERDYWLRNLPKLNDAQCQKLQGILNVKVEVPFEKEIDNFIGAVVQAAQSMQTA